MSGVRGTTIVNGVGILAGIATGLILARSLGPGGRGELAAALLWSNIFVLFADLGLGFAFSYLVGTQPNRIGELWTLALLSGGFLGSAALLIGWILVPLLAAHLSLAGHQAMKIALLTVPLILTTGYQAFLFLGVQRIAEYNVIKLATPAANLLTVLTVWGLGWTGVRSYALAYLVTQSVSFIICTLMLFEVLKPQLCFKIGMVPQLLRYGIKTYFASMAGQANLRLDQAIMSLFLVPDKLGQYVVAVSVSGVLGPFLSALALVILPRTTHAATRQIGAFLTARHVRRAVLYSLPVLALSVVAMPWLLPALFGGRYAPAVISAQVLAVAGLFQGINSILSNSLRGLGRPGLPAIAESGGIVVTGVLLYMLLPVLGILGAAIASLAAYAVVVVLQACFLARSVGITPYELFTIQPGPQTQAL